MADTDGSARSKPPAALIKATNPMARALAGRRWFPLWAQVHHRGRKSGNEYAIPVAVLVKDDVFIIGLPWGPKTNWVQNVQAAGGCTIRWKGEDYRVTNPQLVDKSAALEIAKGFTRTVVTRGNFPAFLRLTRAA
ncbi:MAG TPA: nitroreductase family deazaflavin-dependent oxidoreductase [Streptosporangiaceae bacterium]|jgi:deazaflavin-dependent oxidoreductase (nitroreductase family)|nr:nitroreductase family deazaflavin-dependent oxidoreductase [Streptosporangiaceae bacterium]